MRDFSASPLEMIASIWRNRQLIFASTKREVLGRYRGSALGLLWSFFNPVFMLIVFTFVFSVVFKARWNTGNDSKTEFALVLFAGLIVFNIFSECLNRAPTAILANGNYVKKVVFPLEILPFVTLLSALFHGAVSLVVWLLAYLILFGLPHLTLLYLPLVVVPFAMFIMGISWALASLGIYLRDVSQLMGTVTTVLLFLSPIFYPVQALPEAYRHFIYLNPMTPVIEQTRAILYFNRPPDLSIMTAYWITTFLIAWIGFAWFQKTRKGFADVL